MDTIALVRLIVGRREKAKTELFDMSMHPKFSARAEMCHSALILMLTLLCLCRFFGHTLSLFFVAMCLYFFSFLFYTDNNECLMGTDRCEQNCHNTVGSYTCSCNAGYTLNSDGRNCNGMYAQLLLYMYC